MTCKYITPAIIFFNFNQKNRYRDWSTMMGSDKIEFENIEQGLTFQLEIDEQTGFQERVISESRNKKLIPTLKVLAKGGEEKIYNLPVGAHLMVEDSEKIQAGKILVKILM